MDTRREITNDENSRAISEIEVFPMNRFVMPVTGEVVDLSDPDVCARTYASLRDVEEQLRQAKALLTDALVEHASRYGARTMRIESAEVTVTEGDTISWDMEMLRLLREEGLPEERWQALVTTTVEEKVSATVARQIARANPRYAEIIEAAQTRTPKRPTVRVALRATT